MKSIRFDCLTVWVNWIPYMNRKCFHLYKRVNSQFPLPLLFPHPLKVCSKRSDNLCNRFSGIWSGDAVRGKKLRHLVLHTKLNVPSIFFFKFHWFQWTISSLVFPSMKTCKSGFLSPKSYNQSLKKKNTRILGNLTNALDISQNFKIFLALR